MEWADSGIILSSRPYGETAAVVTLMTHQHGRHAGLVPGGQSSRRQADLTPGTEVNAQWRGRLAENLGTYNLDPIESHAASVLSDPLRLSAMLSACSLVDAGMPERESHPGVFDSLLALFHALKGTAWDGAYVFWELAFVQALGFGLELDRCAVTGQQINLSYVSPRTGRAVSSEGVGQWKERLLPLPGFLIGQGPAEPADIMDGLRLTGYFLERHGLASRDIPLPLARTLFHERYISVHQRAEKQSEAKLTHVN